MSEIRIKVARFLLNLLLIIATMVFVFVCGEISLRYYHYHRYGTNLLNGANAVTAIKDNKLGWKTAANLSWDIKQRDALGKVYNIHFTTNKYGFRRFGNPTSDKLKILFVGDSFTEAFDVSDDKTYYAICEKGVKNVDVFAFGEGGYSSLQELMILDESLHLITPDIIVFQFYEDNFFRNDYKLDVMLAFYNTGMPRPFIDLDGRISSRYPKVGNLFINFTSQISANVRLLKVINQNLSFIFNVALRRRLIDDINKSGVVNEEFGRSVVITKLIMSMIKLRAGKIPVYLFSITDKQPFYDSIKTICQSVDIHFIDGVPQALDNYENKTRYITKANDKQHLNELGQRIIGEELIKYFNKNKVTVAY